MRIRNTVQLQMKWISNIAERKYRIHTHGKFKTNSERNQPGIADVSRAQVFGQLFLSCELWLKLVATN